MNIFHLLFTVYWILTSALKRLNIIAIPFSNIHLKNPRLTIFPSCAVEKIVKNFLFQRSMQINYHFFFHLLFTYFSLYKNLTSALKSLSSIAIPFSTIHLKNPPFTIFPCSAIEKIFCQRIFCSIFQPKKWPFFHLVFTVH